MCRLKNTHEQGSSRNQNQLTFPAKPQKRVVMGAFWQGATVISLWVSLWHFLAKVADERPGGAEDFSKGRC
jgi:hypothetical protein